MAVDKERIDILLVEAGFAASQDRAQRLLLSGQVLVDDRVVDKAGARVSRAAAIRLRGEDHPFVGRGGLKLRGALDDLGLDVTGLRCLDVGASTGGFTDCLLQAGAARVVAVDVGTNQLHWRLRTDPRVRSMEQTDIRRMSSADLGEPVDLVVVDASFVSLRLLLPPIAALVAPGTPVLALVKPQFEVDRSQVGKGGLVWSDKARLATVDAVADAAREAGFDEIARVESQLSGARAGNREVFLLVRLRAEC